MVHFSGIEGIKIAAGNRVRMAVEELIKEIVCDERFDNLTDNEIAAAVSEEVSSYATIVLNPRTIAEYIFALRSNK